MNSPAVLDSSALLALLLTEPGGDLLPFGRGFAMSAVNLSEVHARLLRLSRPTTVLRHAISALVQTIPFTAEQAISAAFLERETRVHGLSLGDRACLALAMELDTDVFTADRVWAELKLPCRIHVIR